MKVRAWWFVIMCAAAPAAVFAEPSGAPQQTVDNLNTAIAGEANASHRYTMFAAEADQEGYAQVARLFRAAALAESIHQKNHEAVLRGLGSEPKVPVIEEVKVGTTRENLELPIRGEAKETAQMYPQIIEQARAEHVPGAVRSFTYARDTEAEHLKLFEDALAHLGHNRRVDYYVGKVSGDTTTRPTSREAYTKIE